MSILNLGETDWKVLVINVDDPIAPEVNGNYLLLKLNNFKLYLLVYCYKYNFIITYLIIHFVLTLPNSQKMINYQ